MAPAADRARWVLHVEDVDEDFEALTRAVLRRRPDVQVIRCVDIGEARDLLVHSERDGLPALVLLDLNLPGGSGRELLRWLRAQLAEAELPVVILSTSRNPADVEGCEAEGADGYLFKPVDPAEFADAVVGTIDRWIPAQVA